MHETYKHDELSVDTNRSNPILEILLTFSSKVRRWRANMAVADTSYFYDLGI